MKLISLTGPWVLWEVRRRWIWWRIEDLSSKPDGVTQEPKGGSSGRVCLMNRPITWDPSGHPCMFFRSMRFISSSCWSFCGRSFWLVPRCSSQHGCGRWRESTSRTERVKQKDIGMEGAMAVLFVCLLVLLVLLLMREIRGLKAVFWVTSQLQSTGRMVVLLGGRFPLFHLMQWLSSYINFYVTPKSYRRSEHASPLSRIAV